MCIAMGNDKVADEEARTNVQMRNLFATCHVCVEEIFKNNIWALAMCFITFTYNLYFSRKIKKYLLGQCPNMRLSCIGKYPRNAMNYKVNAK